ncbi:MAG: HAMP domain-containing histidine kinase [Thermotogae bacterium]|nr:HAMP domain-containing histidine kinase [Thermotogota bacterium]
MGLSLWVVSKLEDNAKSSSRSLSILVSSLLISSLSNRELYNKLKSVTRDIDFPVAIFDNSGKLQVAKNVSPERAKYLPFKEEITYYGKKIGELRYDYPSYTRWLRLINVALFMGILIISLLFFYTLYIAERYEYTEFWAGFAKGLAHQLATPISSLHGWYEVVKDRLPEEVRRGMERDLKRLTSILRRFSKLGGEPELVEVELEKVLEDVVHQMRNKYKSTQILFESHPVKVIGDAELIGWAVENFIKNSVEAGATRVKVYIRPKGEKVCVIVEDNGKGFDREGLKKAFKKSFSTKQRGWGVGLTLVKKIAQIHGGEVFIEESSPYYRTAVVFCLKAA